MRNAKLTEYKFLHILRGFADEKTPKELAATAKVSEKTIRALYKALRNQMIIAAVNQPGQFGLAGYFLFDESKISRRALSYLDAVVKSPFFDRYSKLHAPRRKNIDQREDIIFDVGIRAFCRIAQSKDLKITYSEHAKATFKNWKFLAAWFENREHDQAFLEEHAALYEDYQQTSKKINDFLRLEQLVSVLQQSTVHRFANNVLYRDLRSYLLKKPLS